ncbi:ArsR/SmtB family transcription factor [Sphaerisporangium rufum]|uniref:ArsR/SmtB family transcription factor n=1 Tax=Sphaerisporangium rufum TaxID=1381558 RepID=UPI001950D99A|nr:helix-turn-helix domain-containing protein [Sphaerisporangium rufum]
MLRLTGERGGRRAPPPSSQDGARRHILQVLVARGGTLTAGELSSRFSHSWPTTSRHLGVLLDAGIVSVATVGRRRHYQVERQRLGGVLALWLRAIGFELRPAGDGG